MFCELQTYSVQNLEKFCSEVVSWGGSYMGNSLTSPAFGRVSDPRHFNRRQVEFFTHLWCFVVDTLKFLRSLTHVTAASIPSTVCEWLWRDLLGHSNSSVTSKASRRPRTTLLFCNLSSKPIALLAKSVLPKAISPKTSNTGRYWFNSEQMAPVRTVHLIPAMFAAPS